MNHVILLRMFLRRNCTCVERMNSTFRRFVNHNFSGVQLQSVRLTAYVVVDASIAVKE